MDPLLLDYYNRELIYMREMASEFAASHPKIARRLGMQGIEVADPYVERLIESFSFMSARMQIKLDAEFPRLTQRLLDVLYPNYLSPTPSMAVAQLHPNHGEGDFRRGFVVPRGTAFHAKVPDGEVTPCEFRSSQDVTLWPIEIVDAQLTGAPPDIPALDRYPVAESENPAQSRSVVLKDIYAARRWFEANEPSSPVAVLLKQAERMVGQRFAAVADAIPLDLLRKWDSEPDEPATMSKGG